MSRTLEEYGEQKSSAITVARRLAEFLGDQMVKDAGLACKFIVAAKPVDKPVTERAIPVAIFEAEAAVRYHYLRRWLKDRSMAAEDMEIRQVIDWNYYRGRLDAAIQKIITIPAAIQKMENPVPRVKHPEWLVKKVASLNDAYQQKSLKSMFSKAIDDGAAVMDIEEAAGGGKEGARKGVVVHRRGKRVGAPQGGLTSPQPGDDEGERAEGEGEGEGEEGPAKAVRFADDDEEAAAADDDAADVRAFAQTAGSRKLPMGSKEWMDDRKARWRAIRAARKRAREEETSEAFATSFNNPRRGVAQAAAGGGKAGVDAFYQDTAQTVNNATWQILTLMEAGANRPGELVAWVVLGGEGGGAATLQKIPIRVPRTVYVSTRASRDGVDGWTKVSRTLPRAATAQHLYEVSMSEDSYVRSAEVRGWDADKDVVGVYHSHYSPLVKAAVQLGCCAVVQRGTRRRAPQEGFDLGEVKMSARETKYLAIADIEAQESAAATPLKQLVVYAAGSGTRGVLAAFAGWHKSALLLLVRPRGSALNDQARASLAAHPLASEEGYDLTLDTVDSWAAGYARLQRLLPALQAAAKAPLVALAQTDVGLAELHERVPALHQLPCVAVPHNRADGSWDERLLLGAAWQPVALDLALRRCEEVAPWWEGRLGLARYAKLPVGVLGSRDDGDAPLFASDVMLQRRLLISGHLSWISPAPSPDLGGAPDGEQNLADELQGLEVTVPGMHRTVCVELKIMSMCVNSIVESGSVGLGMGEGSGMGVAKDMVVTAGADGGGHASALPDETSVSSAFALVKSMVKDWLRDVLTANVAGVDTNSSNQADVLLMNVYRWLSTSSSLLYEPLLHRFVHSLMKKVRLQLLAELITRPHISRPAFPVSSPGVAPAVGRAPRLGSGRRPRRLQQADDRHRQGGARRGRGVRRLRVGVAQAAAALPLGAAHAGEVLVVARLRRPVQLRWDRAQARVGGRAGGRRRVRRRRRRRPRRRRRGGRRGGRRRGRGGRGGRGAAHL